MHPLQKMWPHFVVISSSNVPIQTGQLKVASFTGAGGAGGAAAHCPLFF